ncbi:hypothetical protein DVH05_001585 [Phytophthora capsici]|nr:hypothetical protein DVH05_001585 [Phytophthora capsici]
MNSVINGETGHLTTNEAIKRFEVTAGQGVTGRKRKNGDKNGVESAEEDEDFATTIVATHQQSL